MPKCECGNHDLSCFAYDNDSSDPICTKCGLVQQDNVFDFDDILDYIKNNSFPGRAYKGTYQRKVHLTERLREHNREEPQIPEMDILKITEQHQLLISTNYFYRKLATTNQYGKKEIQKLLRSIDKKEGTKKFSRLYLGK